ncbi:BON domain-containing protein [Thiococcus pfennigii]|uniref:BON domain-containing protein n=1 Tax=Thiococcus pfennigii TaxID=1057 RepID=UPI001908AFB6|nr:BON domain-containing protein [Thiococcus pfennigii]MBK1732390.1 hypothetical protein [Thiococcus pfennigii]
MQQGTRTWAARFVPGLALVAMLAGCGSTGPRQVTARYIDDSVIKINVRAAIVNDASLAVRQLGIETYNGVVELSGVVDSQQAVARAGKVARSVDGVRSVSNSLRVEAGS